VTALPTDVSDTATVETLTAQVRVLMVGNRQVTLSVFRQLDEVGIRHLEPFGRVNDKTNPAGYNYAREGFWLVGRSHNTGALVRAFVDSELSWGRDNEDGRALYRTLRRQPLIVLAGLR
jgi:hypothetical protein